MAGNLSNQPGGTRTVGGDVATPVVVLDAQGNVQEWSGGGRLNRDAQATTITDQTETTIVTAGGAGVFKDLYGLIVSNTSATPVRVDIRRATAGSILFSLWCPAGQPAGFTVPGAAIPQTTAANNWTATASASVTDLRITALYETN